MPNPKDLEKFRDYRARFPEFRYEVANGLALCVPCHQKANAEQRGVARRGAFTLAGIMDPTEYA